MGRVPQEQNFHVRLEGLENLRNFEFIAGDRL